MIKIVAKCPVQAEKVEAFKAMAKELVEKSAAEDGNVYYTLNADKNDPTLLAFMECWKDQEAIDIHGETEHFTRILPQLAAMCTGDMMVETYNEVEF